MYIFQISKSTVQHNFNLGDFRVLQRVLKVYCTRRKQSSGLYWNFEETSVDLVTVHSQVIQLAFCTSLIFAKLLPLW